MCQKISFNTTVSQDLQNILDVIATELNHEYGLSKLLTPHHFIRNIFQRTSGIHYSMKGIVERLMIIEEYYSTNAAYSYYSFDEMANEIMRLGSERKAKQYFAKYQNLEKLFSSDYGIHKNISKGDKQISLLSKYAYYQLFQDNQYPLGFPIYDRLVHKSYPYICKILGISPIGNAKASITSHIKAFDGLREKIWESPKLSYMGIQQFDLLDAYLWRMGKFMEGNIGNLMSKEDYILFINNINLACLPNETDKQYKFRMFNTYAKTAGANIVSYNSHKKIYSLDFDRLVLYILRNKPNGIDPFNGLAKQKYLEALYNHWIKYY